MPVSAASLQAGDAGGGVQDGLGEAAEDEAAQRKKNVGQAHAPVGLPDRREAGRVAAGLPLKPDPASVAYVVQASGYNGPRTRIWIVGDNYTDLEAARAAGARSCFCRFGFGHPHAEIPTATADSAEELLENIVGAW